METLKFGRYEVLGAIGAGGMGEVYAARDPQLGRRVAIKKLPLRLSNDRDTLTRFTAEARSASALNHPNIVTIHEVGADGGAPYIVMEYIEGTDLRSRIQDGPQPIRDVLDVGTQIADGLAAAHERGIVHRDLKPENIMVTRDGFVKILDFGLAKMTAPTPEGTDTLQLETPGTTPGTILGTVGYMSPEQATGKRIDFRSDQFALGAILYELTTGRAAFEAENAIDTLSAILHKEPEPIGRFSPRAPQQLADIIQRLLSKSRDGRYNSARDLARELRLLRDRVSAEESGFHTSTPHRRVAQPRRVALITAAAALALFIAGYFIVRRPAAPAPAPPTPAAAPVAAKKYLAVLRFKDLSGDANGQLVVDGFAETLSARLARFATVQVLRAAPNDEDRKNARLLAKDLGADLVLTGSMQREGERLRVSYSIVDLKSGGEKRDLIDGPVSDLFGIQDQVASSIAQAMELAQATPQWSAQDRAIAQRKYLEALGHLRRYDDDASVDRAIAILDEVDPRKESASAQAALGRAYFSKYLFTRDPEWASRAAAACQRAVTSDPQNVEVHVTLGDLYRNTGRYPEALNEYKRALEEQPNSIEAILGTAETHNAAGRVTEAEREYRHAIALQPNYWSTYNRLGVFFYLHGKYADAAAMFKRVVELVPDNLRGYNNLGAAYQQLGQYDVALNVFSDALAQKPTADTYSNIGTCYYFLGRYNESAATYEKATELAPNDHVLWQNLGEAYSRIPGAGARARVAFTRAIELGAAVLRVNDRDVATHAAMAVCHAKLGDFERAEQHLAAARRIDPTNLSFTFKAAKVAALRGDDAAALQLLRDAMKRGYSKSEIERDPDFTRIKSRLH